MKFRSFYFLFIIAIWIGCEPKPTNQQEQVTVNVVEDGKVTKVKDSLSTPTDKPKEKPSVSIMVIPCSNGYEYVIHGYDFNPVLERELGLLDDTNIETFPLKKMMGVAYHGVFDKKYCAPIVERVDVDYLIMTRFISNQGIVVSNETPIWGYETKILNTKTMEQMNSIKAKNLSDYTEIETHIKKNVALLRQNLEELK